jgi:DnaJ family protein A protein 2
MPDLYSLLGVPRDAETSQIRTAYKQLAKEHHPDKGGDPEKFKEISQAHEILSDESRRKMYDMTGSTSEQQQGGMPFPGGMPGGMPFGMPEVFSQMFGGGMFSGHGQGPQGNRKQNGKGPGKTQDLPLRIVDFYNGRKISLKLGRQAPCSPCKGSGALTTKPCDTCGGQGQVRQVIQMGPMQMMTHGPCQDCQASGQKSVGKCSSCDGRGSTPEEKTLEITIEPGMSSGNTVLFPGMCSAHPAFTETGDLTILLREADEEGMAASWSREGTKLKTTVTVCLTDVILGCKKVLIGHPGFPNGVPIEIPAGVQNMWTGTIPGLGMPIRGASGKFGEAYVTVLVVPTSEETQALRDNTVMLQSLMPKQGPVPTFSEEVRTGRWSQF